MVIKTSVPETIVIKAIGVRIRVNIALDIFLPSTSMLFLLVVVPDTKTGKYNNEAHQHNIAAICNNNNQFKLYP